MSKSELGPGSRVRHKVYGDGAVIRSTASDYEICFMASGMKEVAQDSSMLEIVEAVQEPNVEVFSQFEKSLVNILKHWSDASEIVPLGNKWTNGKLLFTPGDGTKGYELPVNTFFHKIVMLRDRLRVMEQKINANARLTDEEKVDLQQYITRCYGSLTSFNILFKIKEQHFVGESGDK